MPSAAGEGLVDGRLEASHMLHWCALAVARLQVLIQDGDDLVIENLELANSLHHLLQRHIFNNLIFAIMFLDFKEMVAEIQHSKTPLLPKKYDDHTAGPV